MPRTSPSSASKQGTSRLNPSKPVASKPGAAKPAGDRATLRKRVGAFVRKRREQLGLSQGDIIRALGYVSRNSVSNIETGREGLPAKRIYAWADVLKVPHDAFFRFATGESKRMDADDDGSSNPGPLSTAELDLLAAYRDLSAKAQRQVRAYVKELT